MTILVIGPGLPNVGIVHNGGIIGLRSSRSSLLSLTIDVAILLPGCPAELKQLAEMKAQPVNGKVVDFSEYAIKGST